VEADCETFITAKATSQPRKHTEVSDLIPLKNLPLRDFNCARAKVADLSPLKTVPLTSLTCDFIPERDTKAVRSIKTIEKINKLPGKEF
jgi:hypothetical protein